MSKQRAWKVWFRGCEIDVVWFITSMAADEVRQSLIDHDGYHPLIEVTLDA